MPPAFTHSNTVETGRFCQSEECKPLPSPSLSIAKRKLMHLHPNPILRSKPSTGKQLFLQLPDGFKTAKMLPGFWKKSANPIWKLGILKLKTTSNNHFVCSI